MNLQELGITKEQILELAASKIAAEYGGEDYDEMGARVERIIQQRVRESFDKGLSVRIDNFLQAEMERLITQQVSPVNIWGEKSGEPTTIRDCLAARAAKFWEVKVDQNNREVDYGGKPRYEKLMGEILKEKFTEAIKANADLILSEFKKAVKEDAMKTVAKHIDELIRVK